MFKVIIPNLVTFDTDLNELPSFVMCEDFNFFSPSIARAKFHYQIICSDKIETPKKWTFRSEYTFWEDGKYFYSRKFLFWNPTLCYDPVKKSILINNDYLRLPFHIGGIPTVGETISGLIELDLMLDGVLILRGIAFSRVGEVIAISSPGFNGKTTFLKEEVMHGSKYVAEDYLILGVEDEMVYPSCPLTKERWWRARGIDRRMKNLFNENNVISSPTRYKRLIFLENLKSSDKVGSKKTIDDYLLLNSMFFMSNYFVRSYIFDQSKGRLVYEKIHFFVKKLMNSEILMIANYGYKDIL